MVYVVQWTNSAGVVSIAKPSAAAALAEAQLLIRDGARHLSIRAPDGQVFRADEFKLLKGSHKEPREP